jgi:hypothetical protein
MNQLSEQIDMRRTIYIFRDVDNIYVSDIFHFLCLCEKAVLQTRATEFSFEKSYYIKVVIDRLYEENSAENTKGEYKYFFVFFVQTRLFPFIQQFCENSHKDQGILIFFYTCKCNRSMPKDFYAEV